MEAKKAAYSSNVICSISCRRLTHMLSVILGAHLEGERDRTVEVLRLVTHIKVHEKYVQLENNDECDLGILTLNQEVIFTKFVQQATLATPGKFSVGFT